MVLQLIVYAPLALSVLELEASGQLPTTLGLVGAGARNPVSIAAALGVVLSATSVSLPEVVGEPISLLGGMAVPGALLAFGISLRLGGPIGSGQRLEVAWIAVLKLVWQPAVAYVLARFGRSELLARDSVAVSTVLSVPVLFGLAAALA
jgi:predicted permease